MFFPEKITLIKPDFKVLEIGPGASPHPRSDVFLELQLSDEEYEKQFGHEGKLHTDKPVIFYDGKRFPFDDDAFDYVICSHVLEHVPDVPAFLEEVFRVAKRGYFEFPLITYDYLFNFDVHLNFLRIHNGELIFRKKDFSSLNPYKSVQHQFLQMMNTGHFNSILTDLHDYFFQGFEFTSPFPFREEENLDSFIFPKEPAMASGPDLSKVGMKKLSTQLIQSILSKIKS